MNGSRCRGVVVAVALAALTGCASDATRSTGDGTVDTSSRVVDDTDASDTNTGGTPADDPDLPTTEPSPPDTGAASAAPATPAPSAVVNVEVQPGLADDGFVGARGDVTVERCESSESDDSSAVRVFRAEGQVTNSTESDAAYRIYVAFNPPGSTVSRGLIQVDDILVSAGESAPWGAEFATDDTDLTCILRVERVAAP